MTNIAVTGTRKGATPVQLDKATDLIGRLLEKYGDMRMCQGCCIGFDEEITVRVKERWPAEVSVCGHPPLNEAVLSVRALDRCDRLMTPADYLARDRNLVRHAGDRVLAAPHGFRVQTRGSGTWYTVNYAVDLNRPTVVVYPDGTTRPGWAAVGKVGNGERTRGSRRARH